MVSVFLFKFESFLVFLFEPGPWLWGVWHHIFVGHSHWGIGKDFCFHCFGQRCSEKSRSCWIQCGAQRTTGTSRFAGHGGFHRYHKHAGPFNDGPWPVDLKKLANPPSWIFEFDQKVLGKRFDSFKFSSIIWTIVASGWYLEDALAHPNDLHCFGFGSLGRRLCYLARKCAYEMSHAVMSESEFILPAIDQNDPILQEIAKWSKCLVFTVNKWSDYSLPKPTRNLTNDPLPGSFLFQSGLNLQVPVPWTLGHSQNESPEYSPEKLKIDFEHTLPETWNYHSTSRWMVARRSFPFGAWRNLAGPMFVSFRECNFPTPKLPWDSENLFFFWKVLDT